MLEEVWKDRKDNSCLDKLKVIGRQIICLEKKQEGQSALTKVLHIIVISHPRIVLIQQKNVHFLLLFMML